MSSNEEVEQMQLTTDLLRWPHISTRSGNAFQEMTDYVPGKKVICLQTRNMVSVLPNTDSTALRLGTKITAQLFKCGCNIFRLWKRKTFDKVDHEIMSQITWHWTGRVTGWFPEGKKSAKIRYSQQMVFSMKGHQSSAESPREQSWEHYGLHIFSRTFPQL